MIFWLTSLGLAGVGSWWLLAGLAGLFTVLVTSVVLIPMLIQDLIAWPQERRRRKVLAARMARFDTEVDALILAHHEKFPEEGDVDENGIPFLV